MRKCRQGFFNRATLPNSSGIVCFVAMVAGTLVAGVPAFGQNSESTAGMGQAEQALDASFDFVVEDIHLAQALERISDQFQINLIVDNRVVRPLDGATDIPAPAYVTDGRIAYVNLKNVSLREGLSAILRPLGLTFSVEENFIWISTAKNIRHESFEGLVTRFYELEHVDGKVSSVNAELGVRDAEQIDVVNLLNHVVPRIVQPNSTEPVSFMRLNKITGQLIVHNTPSNHRIVVQALLLVERGV